MTEQDKSFGGKLNFPAFLKETQFETQDKHVIPFHLSKVRPKDANT